MKKYPAIFTNVIEEIGTMFASMIIQVTVQEIDISIPRTSA